MQGLQLLSGVTYRPVLHTHIPGADADAGVNSNPTLQLVQLFKDVVHVRQVALQAAHTITLLVVNEYVPSTQAEHTPLYKLDPEAQVVHAVAVQLWQLAGQATHPREVFLYPALHTHAF